MCAIRTNGGPHVNAESQSWMVAASEAAEPSLKHRLKPSHPSLMEVYATLAIAEALNRLAAAVERMPAK